MSHRAQVEFVEAVAAELPHFFTNSRVLEIGSLDVNGTIRSLVKNPIVYVGIDLGEGPGVDVIADGSTYESDQRFELIISCECLEHNPHWIETLHNAVRHLDPCGIIVLSFATIGRREHGTSRSSPDSSPFTVSLGWNYYKNLKISEVSSELEKLGLATWIARNNSGFDGYVIATFRNSGIDLDRSGSLADFKRKLRRTNCRPKELFDLVFLNSFRVREIQKLPITVLRFRFFFKQAV